MPVDKFGRMSDTKTKDTGKLRIPEYHLLILIIIMFEAIEALR